MKDRECPAGNGVEGRPTESGFHAGVFSAVVPVSLT